MNTHPLILLVTLFVTSCLGNPTVSSSCTPNVNCKLPDCRCWNDPQRPGNIKEMFTPQMIILTFTNGLTNWTVDKYLSLIKDLKNPNGCPAKATFFADEKIAEEKCLQTLYQQGHEIAVTTSGVRIPKTKKEWLEDLLKSTSKLLYSGIPITEELGVLAPFESMGGNNQMEVMKLLANTYDSTCILDTATIKAKGSGNLWPYTYDFVDGVPNCKIGLTPNRSFTGTWQFPIPEMTFNEHTCSKLSKCSPYIKSAGDTFAILYNAFEVHYYAGRAPMVLNIDSELISGKDLVSGLKQFLSTIRRHDIWLVSMKQAQEWIRNPKPISGTESYIPWNCNKN